MDYLYDFNQQCIYCNKTFKTKRPKLSRLPQKSIDTDFYIRYDYLNPYLYEAVVCPHCAMAFTEKFAPLSESAMQVVHGGYLKQAQREDLCGQRTVEQGLRALKQALVCASLTSQSPVVFVGLCMRVAWLNRDLGNEREEIQFLQRAYDTFEHTYTNARVNDLQITESYLLHMLAELSCRLNQPEHARKWFGVLFSHKSDYKYLNAARDRWQDYRENLKSGSTVQ